MGITLRIVSYVVVLVVGGVVGAYIGSRYWEGRQFAQDLVESNYYAAYMTTQLDDGTDVSREEALRGFLALIDRHQGYWTAAYTPKVHAVDSVLTNARLAILAQKRGAADEANAYRSHALALCPSTGWQDCSWDKVNDFVHKIDKRGIFSSNGKREGVVQ